MQAQQYLITFKTAAQDIQENAWSLQSNSIKQRWGQIIWYMGR